MKKYLSYIVIWLCGLSAHAQSPAKNYILVRQMLDANGSHAITTISYYDDLGNEDEVATTGLGGQGKYAYTKKEYSVPGQVVKEWIPGATSSDGCYLDAPSFISSSSSFFNDGYPFVTNDYDALGRVVSTMQPGANWVNAHRSVRKRYGTNAENNVKKYVVSSSGALEQVGFYASGALLLEMSIDEDGNTLQVFTDVVGRKILERRADSNDTYYIYDDLGLLCFVLSPSYQEEANLEKYGYEYRYDQRGRCVWKRLPGCEYLQLWYDYADNLMFSQDGEQRRKGIYVFHLYDNVKRLVLQGTTTAINADCSSALVSINVAEAGLCNSGYSSTNSLGLRNEQLLQANYYDNHNFLSGQLTRQATSHSLAATQGAKEDYSIGSLTGTINMATDGKPLVSVYYHDMREQVIESMQTMPDDALLSQTISYSFTKKPLSITSTINKGGVITNVTQSNKYNEHNDKIETMTLQVGNVTRMVASYGYDDIGRLVSINRSGNAGSVHYDYNIRNRLKETKSDRFFQSLYYESTENNPCFNGNISRMQWQSSKDHVLRGYDFAYDGLNRLEKSDYGEGADLSQNKSHYSEHVLSYSPNGSIERLQRYGKRNNGTFGLIDDLTYTYNGNQIESISDKAGSLLYDGSFDFKDGVDEDVEYYYDANGALVNDLNKGISNIEYDVIGNLKCITFDNGFKTKYIYDAAGNKLRTSHESVVTNTTDYIGNFIFEDGKLDKYLFDGGYCSFDNNQNPTFHYYEKDHLGSVRMVVNENGTIEQVNHYYPFGGVYGDLAYNAEAQRNKYIGKEFDHMHGLDCYDHGARMYDAAKVAWDRVDRLSEKYSHLSPYLYCGNNPVVFFDYDGCKTRIYIETNGLGHTFVTVGEGRNTVVYTYGRYGALGSSGSVLRSFTPTGEGVLYRKTGKQAALYLKEELEKGNLSIYAIEKGSDEKVADFFDKMWAKGSRPTEKKAKNDPNAKVIDEYDILDNNCTTKTIDALNYKQDKSVVPSTDSTIFYDFGGSYEYKDKIVAPVTLKSKLDEMHRTDPHNIIKINNINEFILNLQKQLLK